MLDAERLLGAYMQNDKLFRPITKASSINKWRCYVLEGDTERMLLKALLNYEQLIAKVTGIAEQLAHSTKEAPVCALVPEVRWTSQHEEEIRAALWVVIVDSTMGATPNHLNTRLHSRAPDKDTASDRERLLRERKKMLDAVGTYSSEDLASAVGSTTRNASQFAADQRSANKLFGVRFGQAWHYPKFQFDAKRHTLPEMKAVLSALSPDDQGWDRLQWFLEPHETLRGRTPLEVWKTHREKVIEAANTERWDGRD